MGIRASLSPELSLVGMCSVVIELVRCPRIAVCMQGAMVFAGYYYALPDGFGYYYHLVYPKSGNRSISSSIRFSDSARTVSILA